MFTIYIHATFFKTLASENRKNSHSIYDLPIKNLITNYPTNLVAAPNWVRIIQLSNNQVSSPHYNHIQRLWQHDSQGELHSCKVGLQGLWEIFT